jgi:uncharacterized Zn-binding protein involved in type VI secretion
MPAVARKDSKDTVASPDGSGICCASPSTQSTDKGSSNVFVNTIGAVREGDAMITHPYPGPCCNPHAPTLSSFSSTVFVNGKGIGRLGDDYSQHVISSGSSDVFAG